MSSDSSPTRRRIRSISVILNLRTSDDDLTPGSEPQVPNQVIIFSSGTRIMIVHDGSGDMNFLDLSDKPGSRPASKASIEAMPRIVVSEGGRDCAICLEEYQVGGETRFMPCKHSFHSGCIEKWLGIQGSCPVCRFVMPLEEEEKSGGDGEEGEERRGERWVWIGVGVVAIDLGEDSDSGSESEDADSGFGRG